MGVELRIIYKTTKGIKVEKSYNKSERKMLWVIFHPFICAAKKASQMVQRLRHGTKNERNNGTADTGVSS